jgi:hypothetical protein
MKSTRDRQGATVYEGDYVECITTHYPSIRCGERRRVRFIDDHGNVVLRNDSSPVGESQYAPRYFVRASQHNPQHKKDKIEMKVNAPLYIAIEVGYSAMADVSSNIGQHALAMLRPMADTSGSALKERVRQRILAHPHERWLILSGTTIAETSQPPVVFRDA